MKDTVYFISDAHLGIQLKEGDQREKHLISFLQGIRSSASHLFIVGDLFDFWIEYKHAIRPTYFSVLHQLKLLIDDGVTVYYLAGNHDFALGPFLNHTIGINICSSHLDISLQEKNIHLCHGDGILKSDAAYRFWRSVLRNPINQMVYKLLHPNIGVPFARLFSGSSRYFRLKKYTKEKRMEYLKAAINYLEKGADIIIMAHTHYPEIYDIGGKVYCNVGEWLRQYTYARLKKGKLSLFQYLPSQPPVEIEPLEPLSELSRL